MSIKAGIWLIITVLIVGMMVYAVVEREWALYVILLVLGAVSIIGVVGFDR